MADQNSTSRETPADSSRESDDEPPAGGQINAADTEVSPQVQDVAPECLDRAKPPEKHEMPGKRKPPEKRGHKNDGKNKRSKSNDTEEEVENSNEDQLAKEKRRLRRVIKRTTEAYRCCLCKIRQCEIVFTPCQHLICCDKCSLTVTVCPGCDVPIRSERRVYIP